MLEIGCHGRAALVAGCAALALLAGSPAAAELTAERIWADWQAVAARAGLTLTSAGQTREGNSLTIRAVALSAPVEGARLEAALGDFAFTEAEDGVIEISLAPEATITIAEAGAGAASNRARFLLANEGLAMIAYEEEGRIAYEYSADSLSLRLVEALADGRPADARVAFTLAGVEGYHAQGAEGEVTLDSGMSAAAVDIDVAIREPDGPGRLELRLALQDFDSTTSGTRLELAETGDLAAALAQGFAVAAEANQGPTTYHLSFSDQGSSVEMEGSADRGGIRFELGPERIGYGFSGEGVRYRMAAPDMPVPGFEVAFGEFSASFELPVVASATPRPFAALVRLVDLTVDEGLWSMVDPAEVLARDPAAIVVDLVGELALPFSLFDPQMMMTPEFPGELHALRVRELRASAGGATLTGSGAFIFDNEDRETFPGMPRPMGAVDLRLEGGNRLIEGLVQLGLLPPDQAEMARAMLAFFARPGSTPDSFESTLEITPEGAVTANGMPIQ